MPVIRLVKILLILSVAFLGLQGVFNIMGWESGQNMVRIITSMSAMDEEFRTSWASGNPLLVNLGVLTITAGKLIGGALCTIGAWQMWQARTAPAETFQDAKKWAIVGCAVQMLLFFGVFMYLGGQFFSGWRTEIGQGSIQGAFQLGGSIALVVLFVDRTDR